MKHLIDLHALHQLPRLRRIWHPHTLKVSGIFCTGVAIMLTGSTMAINGHEQHVLPHPVWDMLSYFIHAAGGIPALKQIESIWAIFMD